MNIYPAIAQPIPVTQSKTEKFISKAKLVHGDLYNYEFVEYIKTVIKVNIKCTLHGTFEQSPRSHLAGSGCPICSNGSSTTTEFIDKSIIVHGELYNYEFVKYVHGKTKVLIICKTHGEFYQKPNNHLTGYGCANCAGNQKLTSTERVAKQLAKNSKYRASKVTAIPKWIETDLITQLYIDCKLISEMTGIEHQIDHIVPLNSKVVCGLHCLANLQILSATENLSKSNSYWPDMP